MKPLFFTALGCCLLCGSSDLFADDSLLQFNEPPSNANGQALFASAQVDPNDPAEGSDVDEYDPGEPQAAPQPPVDEAAPAADAGAGEKDKGCTKEKIAAAAKAAANAYKPLYYDNDFSYLDDPCYRGSVLGDRFKQLHCGDCWLVSVGGEYRMRQMSEHNLSGKPLTGLDNDFLLQRTRLFANAKYGDGLRFYGEFIDAASDHEVRTPRNIEVNRADMLNLFADVRMLKADNGDYWFRGGRQEMLYGNQRLISPLDWSNTRRTFDGFKGFFKNEKVGVDAFWTRNVPFSQHIPDDHNFDHPDQSQQFMGVYSTYKPDANRTFEGFFLRLDEKDPVRMPSGVVINGYDPMLFGTRWYYINGDWLHEVEGGYQFGTFNQNQNTVAGYFVVGLGREMKNVKWKPTCWMYYDWASGDADPNDGTNGTFNTYFPLGHKYFGFMDIINRQNIQDINASALWHLHEKVTFLTWFHVFYLEEERDALYNTQGVPIYQDVTGSSGKDIGQEIDLLLTWKIRPRADLVVGYSHFFAGQYFDSPVIQDGPSGYATNGSNGRDADFVYTQFSVQF